MITSLITATPTRVLSEHTANYLHRLAIGTASEGEVAISINLRFSKALIKKRLEEAIDALEFEGKFTDNVKWIDFDRKLLAYDRFRDGNNTSKVAEELLGETDDTEVANKNMGLVRDWEKSIKKYISYFNPT